MKKILITKNRNGINMTYIFFSPANFMHGINVFHYLQVDNILNFLFYFFGHQLYNFCYSFINFKKCLKKVRTRYKASSSGKSEKVEKFFKNVNKLAIFLKNGQNTEETNYLEIYVIMI